MVTAQNEAARFRVMLVDLRVCPVLAFCKDKSLLTFQFLRPFRLSVL